MPAYSQDIADALADAVEFYEKELAMFALVHSALAFVDARDTSLSALVHVKQAMLFALRDLDGRMDVDDGDYGVPKPNAAMRLHAQIDEALMGFPEITVAA